MAFRQSWAPTDNARTVLLQRHLLKQLNELCDGDDDQAKTVDTDMFETSGGQPHSDRVLLRRGGCSCTT